MDAFLVAVTLYVVEGQEAAFDAYESAALARLKGYRGRFIARMHCTDQASGEREPYEFHLLGFPSEAAFSSFVASGAPYQGERERLIAKTQLVTGAALVHPMDR
jgi:uncharacterized protein (DUF1330 family)